MQYLPSPPRLVILPVILPFHSAGFSLSASNATFHWKHMHGCEWETVKLCYCSFHFRATLPFIHLALMCEINTSHSLLDWARFTFFQVLIVDCLDNYITQHCTHMPLILWVCPSLPLRKQFKEQPRQRMRLAIPWEACSTVIVCLHMSHMWASKVSEEEFTLFGWLDLKEFWVGCDKKITLQCSWMAEISILTFHTSILPSSNRKHFWSETLLQAALKMKQK